MDSIVTCTSRITIDHGRKTILAAYCNDASQISISISARLPPVRMPLDLIVVVGKTQLRLVSSF